MSLSIFINKKRLPKKKWANTACSQQVGLGAFFELFLGFRFMLLSNVARVPPTRR
jgi:hypothetical protein